MSEAIINIVPGENPYMDDFVGRPASSSDNNGGDDDSEDYVPGKPQAKSRRSKNKKRARPKKKSNSAAKNGTKSKSIYKTGSWGEDEVKLFKEALEEFGRDWKKVASKMGTRESKSVRSYAQRYFMKLYVEGQDLPKKVQETGVGHTLSGKLLDPKSAAARAYLKNKKVMKKWPLPESTTPRSRTPKSKTAKSSKTASSKKRGRRSKKRKTIERKSADYGAMPMPRKRPRRLAAETGLLRRQQNLNLPTSKDELELHKCFCYTGIFGTGSKDDQPYHVFVNPEATIHADFHAHMQKETEIIGLLSGSWDSTSRTLRVLQAHPCNTLKTEDNTVNVEMDPSSEVEIRHLLEKQGRGHRVVGWYHSHPVFEPNPSTKDIYNQLNYQTLFRDGNSTSNAPFVGLIVGPWDSRMLETRSSMTWFTVKDSPFGQIRGCPMSVKVQPDSSQTLQQENLRDKLLGVVDRYKSLQHTDFSEMWRNHGYKPSGLEGALVMVREETTRLQKLQATMLPDCASSIVDEVINYVRKNMLNKTQ